MKRPRPRRGRPPREHPAEWLTLYLDARLVAILRRGAREEARTVNGHVVALVCEALGVEPDDYGHRI